MHCTKQAICQHVLPRFTRFHGQPISETCIASLPGHCSGGVAAGAEADVGQDVFDLSHSLPPDLRGFQQTLSNPSRSAPPMVGLPDRVPSSDPYFSYAPMQNGLQNGHPQKQSLGTAVYDLQAGSLSR